MNSCASAIPAAPAPTMQTSVSRFVPAGTECASMITSNRSQAYRAACRARHIPQLAEAACQRKTQQDPTPQVREALSSCSKQLSSRPPNGGHDRWRSRCAAHRPDFATALRSNPQPGADLRIRQPAVSSLTHACPGDFIIRVPPEMVIDLTRVRPYSVHCRLSITRCLWTTSCAFALILGSHGRSGLLGDAAIDRNCRQTVS